MKPQWVGYFLQELNTGFNIEKMAKFFNSRKWHKWLGIFLSLPIFIVSITAVIIAFQDSFKNKAGEPQINIGWFPGYTKSLAKNEMIKKGTEIKSSWLTPDSTLFLGTGNGLFALKSHKSLEISHFSGMEIRCLQQAGKRLFVGTKSGLYAFELPSGTPEILLKNDIHHLEIRTEKTLAVSDNKSLFISVDSGQSWIKDEQLRQLLVSTPSQFPVTREKTIPLHKFILDLHTGKAFFGKTFEWIWIVLAGLSICFLTFTGIYMWLKVKRLKRRKRNSAKAEK